MRHDPIDPALFVAHRRRLVELLPPRSVAVVHAADILPTAGDGTLRLHPAADLFWLTGIEQEESVLVLGLDETKAVALGRTFGQRAVIVGERGRPARLAWITPDETGPACG